MLQVVAQQPVATLIAGNEEFEHFEGSEIYEWSCGSTPNHALAIVGFGENDDGKKYWILKNSWGEQWGK